MHHGQWIIKLFPRPASEEAFNESAILAFRKNIDEFFVSCSEDDVVLGMTSIRGNVRPPKCTERYSEGNWMALRGAAQKKKATAHGDSGESGFFISREGWIRWNVRCDCVV